MIDTEPKIQVAQRTPYRIISKMSIPRYIILKLPKTEDKEKIFKEDREEFNYGRTRKIITSHFPRENLQAKIVWNEILKMSRKTPLT